MALYQFRQVVSTQSNGVSTVTSTEVTASATAVSLIAANTNRKALSIINESNFEMLVNAGTLPTDAASPTKKILIIPPQQGWKYAPNELPLTALNAVWIGTNPTGKALVVEGV